MKNSFIPWAMPKIFGHEKKWVGKAIDSTWVSDGPFVSQLEETASTLLGIKNVVAVSNGTTALHACYLALGLKPGDEILLPGYGYQGAANIALISHFSPRFVDVDPRTWCMDPQNLEKNITAKTQAVIVIHSYGNVCDMRSIMKIAEKYGVPVIEDCAESF
jgi:perosamine synthetase